ncbi:hypothetical protein RHDC3_01918 [Rhodocyclaceae bacterium]|nr:hypothetical protein RHDC3_01918 [Rhodocyclaceae bacterium]
MNRTLKGVTLRQCDCRRSEGKVLVSVTLANDSDRPLFVIPRVRRIRMDPDTGTLHLFFSGTGERPPVSGRFRTEFSSPRTTPLPERSEKTLTATLPEVMTQMFIREDGSYGFRPLDLREARDVVVEVAVDDKPFYPSPARKDLSRQAAAWGTKLTVRASMETSTSKE